MSVRCSCSLRVQFFRRQHWINSRQFGKSTTIGRYGVTKKQQLAFKVRTRKETTFKRNSLTFKWALSNTKSSFSVNGADAAMSKTNFWIVLNQTIVWSDEMFVTILSRYCRYTYGPTSLTIGRAPFSTSLELVTLNKYTLKCSGWGKCSHRSYCSVPFIKAVCYTNTDTHEISCRL